jgi:hypothetical protein
MGGALFFVVVAHQVFFLCSVFGFVLVSRVSASLIYGCIVPGTWPNLGQTLATFLLSYDYIYIYEYIKKNLDHEVARALLVNDVCKLVVKINEQCRRCMGSALFLLLLRARLSACEVAFGFVLLSRA